MSFLTLGIFWAGQQTQLNHIDEGTRDLTWIHLGFLFAVTVLPLSTRLLAEFITYRAALGIYWLNIFRARRNALLELGARHPHQLIKPDTPDEVRGSICRRIVIAQILYAAGAALCFINTWVSIAAIVLVQLNYAIAPRLWQQKNSAVPASRIETSGNYSACSATSRVDLGHYQCGGSPSKPARRSMMIAASALALMRFGVVRGGGFVVMLFSLGIIGALVWALTRPEHKESPKN